jgi:ribosomal-protein-alanine N-acetyltransferase
VGGAAAVQVRRRVRVGLVRRRFALAARRLVGTAGPARLPELPPAVFPVRLAGERVVLRELEATDADAYARLTGDPDVCRFMKVPPVAESTAVRSLTWKLLRARQPDRSTYELAVEHEGRFVGTVTLHLIDAGTAELAFWILPHASGKGLATDASATLLRFGAASLRVHRINATCDPENERAVALLERLGLTREGRMRQAVRTHLGWRDRLVYGRLLDDSGP